MSKYKKLYTVKDIGRIGTSLDDFGCIYMIKNIKNGKCYIGQTFNFFKRSRAHIGRAILKKGLHIDLEMSKSTGDFVFSVLETYEDLGVNFHNMKIRTITEHRYINDLKTYRPFGYNISRYEFL